MTNTNEHGGKRSGAGRKKKTDSEKEAIRLWYYLVCDAVEYPRTGKVSGLWDYIDAELKDFWLNPCEKKEIFGKKDVCIKGKTAWYGYKEGDKYPDREVRKNIDNFIIARNSHPNHKKKNLIRHPIRWILARTEKLKLSPVWGWSPFNCIGVPQDEIPFAALIHAQFYESIQPEMVFPFLQETVLNVQQYSGHQHDYKWPPILLLPTALVESRTTIHPSLPHPYLMHELPAEDCPLLDYENNLRLFAKWSFSKVAKSSSGLTWYNKIPNYLKLLYDLDNVKFISRFHGGILNSFVSPEVLLEFANSISPAFGEYCTCRLFGIPDTDE